MFCEVGGSRLFRNVGNHVKDHNSSNAGGHNINLIVCRFVRNVLVIVTKFIYVELNAVTRGSGVSGVIQEEMSVFLEVTVSVVVRIKVRMDICLILNDYRYSAVLIPRPNSVKSLSGGWMQNEVYERKVDTRRMARFQFGCCCSHKETRRSTQANNARFSHMSCMVR